MEAFRYLGIEVDRTLSFSVHTEHTYKKAQQRLFLLRKLRSFNVSKDILTVVYRSLIESVLTYNISSWYTFLSVREKSKLSRIIKHASKITGTTQSSLSDLHTQAVSYKATSIIHDPSHPLHNSFPLLPSGRHYRVPLARTNLVKKIIHPICHQHHQQCTIKSFLMSSFCIVHIALYLFYSILLLFLC